jgi:hypothetical protein
MALGYGKAQEEAAAANRHDRLPRHHDGSAGHRHGQDPAGCRGEHLAFRSLLHHDLAFCLGFLDLGAQLVES